MALRSLSLGEMIQISRAWVEAGAAKTILDSIPEMKSVSRRLEEGHAALLAIQPEPEDPELARLTTEGAEVDARHDNLIRGVHGLLTALAALAAEPAQAEELTRLRDLLLPGGTGVVIRSYREEAGEGLRLAQRIGPVMGKLTTIPIPGGNLMHAVNEWLACARRLGEIEDKRGEKAMKQTRAPGALEVSRLRDQWVRAARALESMLDMIGVEPAKQAVLLGPLREAEAAADRRASRRGAKKDDPATPSTPAASGTTP